MFQQLFMNATNQQAVQEAPKTPVSDNKGNKLKCSMCKFDYKVLRSRGMCNSCYLRDLQQKKNDLKKAQKAQSEVTLDEEYSDDQPDPKNAQEESKHNVANGIQSPTYSQQNNLQNALTLLQMPKMPIMKMDQDHLEAFKMPTAAPAPAKKQVGRKRILNNHKAPCIKCGLSAPQVVICAKQLCRQCYQTQWKERKEKERLNAEDDEDDDEKEQNQDDLD